MRLYEFEGKRLFERAGIPIPAQYGVIETVAEIEKLKINFPAMLKAQVLIGGRGKQGGIAKVENYDEAATKADVLLKLVIKDHPVKHVLVEGAVSTAGPCYVGVTMNPANFNNVIMASPEGGVDIEEIARSEPEAILRKEITDNSMKLPASIAIDMAEFLNKKLKCNKKQLDALKNVISKLYDLYQQYDCKVAEINPLFVTKQGPIAADAKIVLDDNGLFRQTELLEMLGIKETKRHDVSEASRDENRAAAAGFPYVDLLPEDTKKDTDKLYVGLVPGGAGYGIFSIDEVANIGARFFDVKVVPINFMDSGGGPSQSKVAEMFHMLMDNELVDIIITSRFGGISSCDVFIRGLVQCLRDRCEQDMRMVPVYGRMVGTDLAGAKTYLEKARQDTPAPLEHLDIVVGNRMIMADVIRRAIEKGFGLKKEKQGG